MMMFIIHIMSSEIVELSARLDDVDYSYHVLRLLNLLHIMMMFIIHIMSSEIVNFHARL